MPAVDAAKAYLMATNEQGVSVYSHLADTLAAILASKPENALDKFEAVSTWCKTKQFTPESAVPPEAPTVPSTAGASEWHVGTNTLLKAPPPDAEEPEVEGNITNLLEEMRFFEWAGVGLSREQSYCLYISMNKLQAAKNLATIRFFGKILGTQKDYYVAECTFAEEPEPPEEEEGAPPPPIPLEERGTGCNTMVYFVTNDPSLPWVELPQVTPMQVSASTKIRKFFTGDLAADVRAFPPFPGKEKEYLRAQIARIVHATYLCPKGKYKLDEEEEGPAKKPVLIEPEEEGQVVPLPSALEMLEPGNWCKYYMGILALGRTTNPPTEEEEEAEEEEEGADPKPKPPPPEMEVMALQQCSDAEWSMQLYSRMGAGCAVAVARSHKWPGAYAAALMKEDKFANVYYGYGHESLPAPYAPPPPPPIMGEPDELVEQADEPLAEENNRLLNAKQKELDEAAAAEAEEAEE